MKHPKIVAVMVTTILAALVLGSTGCEEPGAPKEYRDPANPIYIEKNDEFVIVLESNRTTGYSWQLQKGEEEAAFDAGVLELVSTEYEAPEGDLMGAPGEEKWTFKGIGYGRTHLHFAYVRPWETGEEEQAGEEEEAESAAGEEDATAEEAGEETSTEPETMVFTVDVGPTGSTTKDPTEYTFKDGEWHDKDDKAVEEIEALLGSQFALLLESNPTTGYRWQLAEPLDEARLYFVSQEYEQSKKEGEEKEGEEEQMVGVGGEEIWTFRAVGEGETEISLKYVRSWEAGSPADETATVTVKIVEEEKEEE